MSKKTRINRPTYATPRKSPSETSRMLHVSTGHRYYKDANGQMRFEKVMKGETFKRS